MNKAFSNKFYKVEISCSQLYNIFFFKMPTKMIQHALTKRFNLENMRRLKYPKETLYLSTFLTFNSCIETYKKVRLKMFQKHFATICTINGIFMTLGNILFLQLVLLFSFSLQKHCSHSSR